MKRKCQKTEIEKLGETTGEVDTTDESTTEAED